MSIRVLIAPSGFKESLSADEVADCIERGIRRAVPTAWVAKAPLVDGGEGFTRALVTATDGKLHRLSVTGPVGEPVESFFGFLGGPGPRTAVVEMAAAAGLRLVPRDLRDPLQTTTFGVGELIAAALDAGAERVLLGSGDSGTSDGGAGMAQALGVRLLDEDGRDLPRGGMALSRVERIDLDGRHARIGEVPVDVACNIHNVLCGPSGVARVFGPQKGASPEDVEQLAAALDHYADVIERDLGMDVREMPGGGASGGLGAGLHALIGATLHPRYEITLEYVDLEELLKQADLVITGEGSLDFQTPRGKIPAEVAQRARRHGLPVIALAGTIGDRARVNLEMGISAFASILDAPGTLEEAIEDTPRLLAECAEQMIRTVQVGMELGERS